MPATLVESESDVERSCSWVLDGFIASLLNDVNLTDAEFKRLSRMVRLNGAVKVLLDSRCTPEIREGILEREGPRLVQRLVSEPDASEELLRAAVAYGGELMGETAFRLVEHRNCPSDTAIEAIRRFILPSSKLSCFLFDIPKVVEDPACRAVLRTSLYTDVLERLPKMLRKAPPFRDGDIRGAGRSPASLR